MADVEPAAKIPFRQLAWKVSPLVILTVAAFVAMCYIMVAEEVKIILHEHLMEEGVVSVDIVKNEVKQVEMFGGHASDDSFIPGEFKLTESALYAEDDSDGSISGAGLEDGGMTVSEDEDLHRGGGAMANRTLPGWPQGHRRMGAGSLPAGAAGRKGALL
eukprot:jgi/Mesvir1/12207/Mv00436-RA.1